MGERDDTWNRIHFCQLYLVFVFPINLSSIVDFILWPKLFFLVYIECTYIYFSLSKIKVIIQGLPQILPTVTDVRVYVVYYNCVASLISFLYHLNTVSLSPGLFPNNSPSISHIQWYWRKWSFSKKLLRCCTFTFSIGITIFSSSFFLISFIGISPAHPAQ